MVAAAAEESGKDLIDGRGDAYCGLLNNSYNMGLRKLRPYVPEYPVGIPEEVAGDDRRASCPSPAIILGLAKLKIFSFGPRPQDFLACNAPIKPLYDLGVEVMENSELDLYDIFRKAEGDPKVKAVAADMARELGAGNTYPDILNKLAQFEVALLKFMEANLGASQYGVFADKCWPAFESYFGFVPCYVNSRLAARGIPVACEVDIYGALSEYIATCATELPATILDINNTVPYDMIAGAKKAMKGYKPTDLFMGFHCGNTPAPCMLDPAMRYQLIMHRLMEPGKDPNITRGTLEGRIKTGGDHDLPAPVDRRHGPPVLHGRGRGPRHRPEVVRRHRRHRHQGDGPVLPPRPHREALPAPHGRRLRPRREGRSGRPCACSASRTSASTGRPGCCIRRRTRSDRREPPS